MKDLYQDLLRYYRFMAGKIPNEEFFLDAVKETVSSEDLRVFFLLPFSGYILERKLLQKAKNTSPLLPEKINMIS